MRARPGPVFLATAVLAAAGCGRSERADAIPEPPSIVAPMPASPEPADQGKPGQWEPLAGVSPAARQFVVEPPGTGPAAVGVLVVHSVWGVNAETRALARELTGRGAIVAVPDLFDGVESTTRISAPELVAGVTEARAQQSLRAALKRLQEHPRLAGRPIALLGLGIGGGWGYRLATGGAPFAGLVFDSTPLFKEPRLDTPVKGRVLLIAGADSSAFTPDRIAALTAGFAKGRVSFEIVRIPDAGTDLLDPWALGATRRAYDGALEAVEAFLAKL